MFIYRDRNSTYYTRITLPQKLREAGYPFSIRASLGTKCRRTAIDKNFALAALIRHAIATLPNYITPSTTSKWIKSQITSISFSVDTPVLSNDATDVPNVSSARTSEKYGNTMRITQAFDDFIVSKQAEDISGRSIAQLQLRINHFIRWLNNMHIEKITRKDAMDYRNFLINEGRSYKTTNDYLSAVRQFFKFCVLTEQCDTNYFTGITQGKKPVKRRSDERKRWSREQLIQIFTWLRSKDVRPQDLWVPLLSLYAGLRTSEACQLKVCNIKCKGDIHYIKVDSVDSETDLKNDNAYRLVPIHSTLIKLGFLKLAAERKKAKKQQIFDCQPTNKYNDWSAVLVNRFYWHLNHAGITGKDRPTIYSFRHTFIDELQQVDVKEHIVAEIVGHSKVGITFGRYGKRVNLSLLKAKIELIPSDLVDVLK